MLSLVRHRVGLSIIAAAALPACSSHQDPDSPDAAPATTLCSTDTRAEAYSAGMEQPGASGLLRVRLIDAVPAPPALGTNGWTVEIVDAKGAAIEGATIAVKPFMPDHGHGSSIIAAVAAGPRAGTYAITNVTLPMPGVWTITLTVTASVGTDAATFTFCIPG